MDINLPMNKEKFTEYIFSELPHYMNNVVTAEGIDIEIQVLIARSVIDGEVKDSEINKIFQRATSENEKFGYGAEAFMDYFASQFLVAVLTNNHEKVKRAISVESIEALPGYDKIEKTYKTLSESYKNTSEFIFSPFINEITLIDKDTSVINNYIKSVLPNMNTGSGNEYGGYIQRLKDDASEIIDTLYKNNTVQYTIDELLEIRHTSQVHYLNTYSKIQDNTIPDIVRTAHDFAYRLSEENINKVLDILPNDCKTNDLDLTSLDLNPDNNFIDEIGMLDEIGRRFGARKYTCQRYDIDVYTDIDYKLSAELFRIVEYIRKCVRKIKKLKNL